MTLRLLMAAVAVSLPALCAYARAAEPPAGGVSVLPEDPIDAIELRGPRELAQSEIVRVGGMPFERAVRVEVARRGETPWSAQLALPLAGPVREGSVYLLSAWVRGHSERDEGGEARFAFKLQKNVRPWDAVAQLTVTAAGEWSHVDWPFRAGFSLPADECVLVVHLAERPQAVEIGGIALLDYGRAVEMADLPTHRPAYAGREPEAPWRREAAERIERFRKGDLTVRVIDADGRPVEGAEVSVRMQRHAFGFGSALKARLLCWDTPDARRYQQTVERLYNKVVLENDLKPFSWDRPEAIADEHPRFRREWTFGALRWLKERDIEVRGHYVTWAPLRGRFEEFKDDPEGLRRALFERIEDIVPAVGSLVGEWDAVNHIIGWGTTYADVTGSPQIYADIINHTRRFAPPEVELWVNEGQVLPGGSRRDAYAQVVRYLIERGARPDGIGFMGHFSGSSLTPPAEVYAVLERFAALVPRLQLTEFDVNVADEQLQADYLRDAMTVAFSHPDVEAVVMWGFWEKAHWRRDAALYRADWSPKPAGRLWEDLVFKQWWTDESARTDERGTCAVRGFLGHYAVEAAHEGRRGTAELTLGRDGASAEVVLR